MLNLVIFGPPGAGKGTQSAKLIEKYHLVHLSTGDIFRANIKGGTELGLLAKSYMDKGLLVPDEVTINILESEANKHQHPKGFIFDGFPRTVAQAKALDAMLEKKGSSITSMISLEVPELDELVKRIMIRGKESGRSDDSDANIIQKRITEYFDKTSPVKEYYNAQGKGFMTNGILTIDEVFENLCNFIDGIKVS